MSNKAARLKSAKANPLVVDDAPYYKPRKDQVLIKNAALAINPVDWKVQDSGYFLKSYPSILGEDIAGEVVEVGEGVSQFKKGDRVISHCIYLVTQKPDHAGFQLYTVGFADLTAKIPDSMSYEDASVLPLAISTAASALYMKDFLHLPYPSTDPKPSGKCILIYGGSSSVGALGVQLAAASGVKVIATASAQNHALVKSLGATEVVDYKDPDAVKKITEALKAAGEFAGAYDAIGLPPARKLCADVMQNFGGGFIADVLNVEEGEKLPDNVKTAMCFAAAIQSQEPEVAQAVWGKYVPEALANGTLKCKPDALVVGRGLENVQAALNKHKQGVSGKKVVLTL